MHLIAIIVNLRPKDLIDILFLTVLSYHLYLWFRGTKAFRTLVGLLMEWLTPQKAGAVLDLLSPVRTQKLLAAMSPRQASLVLQYLEPAKREEALVGLPHTKARELRGLMHYPPETVGGVMEPRVASIPMDLNVQSAIGVLRKAPRQTLFYLYVTDHEGKLVGVLNMRNLMLASPRDTIKSLMSREIMSVPGTMDREDVLILMRRHRFLALPVVDAAQSSSIFLTTVTDVVGFAAFLGLAALFMSLLIK
jgi:magnesium transporter